MATFRLTVLGTTDLHSHILDWDYFTDRPYSDSHGNHVGLARLSTLINQVRADRGPATTLTVDSGDTIEGTPLAYYFARIEPDAPHPMALAMNAIGYDAAAIGNHEFNYGLGALERFADQVRHPMLCANATGFTPYLLKKLDTDGPPLTVGILGLVTPGCAIWDKSHLDGKVSINCARREQILSLFFAIPAPTPRPLMVTRCHGLRMRPVCSPKKSRASMRSWSGTHMSKSAHGRWRTRQPTSRCCYQSH
jgi:2',3'-cyclic-nucleotide 2'-phosphodiesterase (5'-nucleotidase family)